MPYDANFSEMLLKTYRKSATIEECRNRNQKNILVLRSIHRRLSGKHLKNPKLQIISLFIEFCLNFKTILYTIQVQGNVKGIPFSKSQNYIR